MRKRIVLKKNAGAPAARSTTLLSVHEIKQDFLRNAHTILESEEPEFVESLPIPPGSGRLILVTRRTNLRVEFHR